MILLAEVLIPLIVLISKYLYLETNGVVLPKRSQTLLFKGILRKGAQLALGLKTLSLNITNS